MAMICGRPPIVPSRGGETKHKKGFVLCAFPLPVILRSPPRATARFGEVSERLKEHAWKVCKRLNPASRVRIPSSPPLFRKSGDAWMRVKPRGFDKFVWNEFGRPKVGPERSEG